MRLPHRLAAAAQALNSFAHPPMNRLNKRARTSATEVGRPADSNSFPCTLIHGDLKAENLFFSEDIDPACAAVDFQWAGTGESVKCMHLN